MDGFLLSYNSEIWLRLLGEIYTPYFNVNIEWSLKVKCTHLADFLLASKSNHTSFTVYLSQDLKLLPSLIIGLKFQTPRAQPYCKASLQHKSTKTSIPSQPALHFHFYSTLINNMCYLVSFLLSITCKCP